MFFTLNLIKCYRYLLNSIGTLINNYNLTHTNECTKNLKYKMVYYGKVYFNLQLYFGHL